ncbi:MAG: aspartate/glutamate racemase family protein [Moraxellaceae bacterium]|nr:aspartate/glutamate racemase family protein [Moraxellaceae bacterium]
MRELLIINPNMSTAVTALLRARAQAVLGNGVRIHARTARFGAGYIACEASYAVAAHAALDVWAAWHAEAPVGHEAGHEAERHEAEHEAGRPQLDAVLLGCFGDPGLHALREGTPVPVVSLIEAAFDEAARHGRFAIVTGGERWGPMLHRLAGGLGQGGMVGVHTVQPSGAQLAANPEEARRLLAEACREAARRFDAQAVILGGAGLGGVAATLQDDVAVPLIDSVDAGLRRAQALAAAHPRNNGDALVRPFGVAWQGVSPELAVLGKPVAG